MQLNFAPMQYRRLAGFPHATCSSAVSRVSHVLHLVSIMSQVTKLLLKIVMDRMKGKIEAELDDAQSGFRQGKEKVS